MSAAATREEASTLIQTLVSAAGMACDQVMVRTALPHFVPEFDANDFLTALRNFDAPLEFSKASQPDLTQDDCPCLYLANDERVLVVLDVKRGRQLVLAAGEARPSWRVAEETKGTAVRFAPLDKNVERSEPDEILRVVGEFRGVIFWLFAISMLTNLMALASPLLVMAIYDQVIPTGSYDMIAALAFVIVAAVVFDLTLRVMRAHAIAFMGGQVERQLGLAVFRKLMSLPLAQLEKSGTHEQIARLRQFESFRDLFTGSLFTTCLDLPFVLIFIAVMFYLAPTVGLLLIGVTAIFFVAAFVSAALQQSHNEKAAAAKTAQQSLLYEISSTVASIQRLGAESYWKEQLDLATEAAAKAARRAKTVQLIAQTFGQSLMMAAGVGAIAFGAISALNEDITLGALIALMAIVWRILGPVLSLYSSITQVKGFISSHMQVRRVLSLEGEFTSGASVSHGKKLSGRIRLANITHRFDPTQEPVLSGVSLSVEPGELTMICGLSGSGRKTLFNLINRFYQPTSGAIYFDDVDHRQLAVDDVRRSVTLAEQTPEFFHGTVRQNFELANPIATDADIDAVIEALGLRAEIEKLPDKLNTRLTEKFQQKMSKSVAKSLGLARCLLRDTSIYLLEDPCSSLDGEHEHRFLRCLQALKGSRTILMTSDRPSHWEIADRLVFLERGKIIVNEARATALPKIKALYEQARKKE